MAKRGACKTAAMNAGEMAGGQAAAGTSEMAGGGACGKQARPAPHGAKPVPPDRRPLPEKGRAALATSSRHA